MPLSALCSAVKHAQSIALIQGWICDTQLAQPFVLHARLSAASMRNETTAQSASWPVQCSEQRPDQNARVQNRCKRDGMIAEFAIGAEQVWTSSGTKRAPDYTPTIVRRTPARSRVLLQCFALVCKHPESPLAAGTTMFTTTRVPPRPCGSRSSSPRI